MRRLFCVPIVILLALAFAHAGEPPTKGFDSKSPKATLEWIAALYDSALSEGNGNELVQETKLKELDGVIKGLVGKEVDWVFPAARITKDGISLRQLTVRGKEPEAGVLGIPRGAARMFTLGAAAPKETEKKKERKGLNGPGTVKTAETYNRPFPVDLDDWVFKLKAGDPVRLEGKITQAKRVTASSTSGRGLGIIVGEFKLSPGDNK
jgi:hypothetical protein